MGMEIFLVITSIAVMIVLVIDTTQKRQVFLCQQEDVSQKHWSIKKYFLLSSEEPGPPPGLLSFKERRSPQSPTYRIIIHGRESCCSVVLRDFMGCQTALKPAVRKNFKLRIGTIKL